MSQEWVFLWQGGACDWRGTSQQRDALGSPKNKEATNQTRAVRCPFPVPPSWNMAWSECSQAPCLLPGSAQRLQPKGNPLEQKLLSCGCLKPGSARGSSWQEHTSALPSRLTLWGAQMAKVLLALKDQGLRNEQALPSVASAPQPG